MSMMPADTSVETRTVGADLLLGAPGRVQAALAGETRFIALILIGFAVAGLTYQTPSIAMWVGFLFAAYAATANDSIQTLGTYLASNTARPWWVLWMFIGGIFLLTMTYSWVVYGGDVSYGRLASKGFATTPTSFSYLQITAPLFLIILTRLKMPVSTTFLCLSGFAASGSSLYGVLYKSMSGYVLAFGIAIMVWLAVARYSDRLFRGKAHPLWTPVQWCTTGLLWSVWLMQDAANVAVFLPRQLSGAQFGGFAATMFLGLGLLFYLRGDRIQQVVTEKSDIVDVRAATLVDLVYAGILFYFKMLNNVPMSTTWVFIGLLAGREIAFAIASRRGKTTFGGALRLMGKDLTAVLFGLALSLVIAAAANPVVYDAAFGSLFAE